MRVPLSWLKDFVEITLPLEDLIHRLTMAGLEVSHVEHIGADWQRDKLFVGEVVEVKPHPAAERLVLAVVEYGQGMPQTVVTGAPNLRPGDRGLKVAFALEGARLHDGTSATPRLQTLQRALMACSTLSTLGEFVVYYGVVGAVGQTALAPVAVVVSRWFERTRRGRAIGFADMGTGFGMVVFVPGSAWLIDTFGWRSAFVLLGAVVILVLVPLNLWHRPGPMLATALTPSTTTLKEMLGRRVFWTLCAAHLCMTITMTMVNVHLVEFLVGTGTLQRLAASTILSAVSLISLGGRVFFGWLADRLHGEGAFSMAMSCTIIGFVMLLSLGHAEARWPLYAFVLTYGFAQGAGGIAVAAKTVAGFQGPYLGTIFMLVNLSANLGAAFGAWLGGRLFDLHGSYTLTFVTAIASGVLAIGCMWGGRTGSQPHGEYAQQGGRI